MIGFLTGDGIAKQTQNAGTRIRRIFYGGVGFTHLVNFRYTDTGTAHTLTIMRGASRSNAAAAVAAAGTSLITLDKLIDGAGNDIATSDVIAVQLDDGTWHLTTVSALDTAKTTITMADAIATGRSVPVNSKVVCYGVQSDAMHANQQYTGGSGSSALNVPAVAGAVLSLCKAPHSNEPLVFDSDNATNAGTLNYANFANTLA